MGGVTSGTESSVLPSTHVIGKLRVVRRDCLLELLDQGGLDAVRRNAAASQLLLEPLTFVPEMSVASEGDPAPMLVSTINPLVWQA